MRRCAGHSKRLYGERHDTSYDDMALILGKKRRSTRHHNQSIFFYICTLKHAIDKWLSYMQPLDDMLYSRAERELTKNRL